MAFSIRFIDEPFINRDTGRIVEETCQGVIKIGSFKEKFVVNLAHWTREDYERQWREALERITIEGKRKTALILSMADDVYQNMIEWWPIWRDGDTAYFQSHWLLLDELVPSFDENDPYQHVGERETATDNGSEISEWAISVDEIKKFMAKKGWL